MTSLQRLLLGLLGAGLLLITLEFIRRRKLLEEYSLLWLLTALVIVLFVLFPQVLYRLSAALQLHHLTTMLLVTFSFLLLIVLHYSTAISQMSERQTELSQQIALLTWQLEQVSHEQAPAGQERRPCDETPCGGQEGNAGNSN